MAAKQKPPSKTYEGTVSSKRQITIPAEAFRALRLRAGDRVTFQVENGALRISPARVDFEALLKEHALPPEASRNALEEIRELRGWTDGAEE